MTLSSIEKTKIKNKWPRMAHFLKKCTNLSPSGLCDAAKFSSHLAERSVHDDRTPEPRQVFHRHPLHADGQVSQAQGR